MSGVTIDIEFRLADGTSRTVSAVAGASVMEVAVDHSVPGIVGECGGEMSCATCHVLVDGSMPFRRISDDEDDLLDALDDRTVSSRLSCQLLLKDDMDRVCVEVPEG